jgi:RecA/RadA recombinase
VECEELVQRIRRECSTGSATALALLKNIPDASKARNNEGQLIRSHVRHIPSGMTRLDTCLRGGIPISSITEVVGRAGVGKTQLAMQFCIMAAKHGRGSIFIDTEKKISLKRLEHIAIERHRSGGGLQEDGIFAFKHPRTVLQNVTLHTPSNTNELLLVIQQLEEEIVIRNDEARSNTTHEMLPVGLVVLDSIAAPTQRDFGPGEAFQRVKAVFEIAQTLKRLSQDHHVAVLVINQVGALSAFSNAESFDESTNASGNRPVSVVGSAALGITWHHCVNARIRLEHTGHTDQNRVIHDMQADGRLQLVRNAVVEKSNVTCRSSMQFEIIDQGLMQLG